VAVADELVGQRPGDPLDVEGHRAVLEHGLVADLKDVGEVPGVRRGLRVGLLPAGVAGTPGEFAQRLPPDGIGVPRHVLGRQELGLGDQGDSHAALPR